VSDRPYANLRVRFGAAHVARLWPFIAEHDIRYYLSGILVERAPKGGVFLCATNGHVLCVIHDAAGMIEGPDDSVVLTASRELLAAAKRAPRDDARASIPGGYNVLVRGTRLFLANSFDDYGGGLERYVQPGACVVETGRGGGRYGWPKWRRLLPDFSKLKRGGVTRANDQGGMVAVRYLASLGQAVAHERRARTYGGIVFWHLEEREQIYVQFQDVPEMMAIIMPMRSDPDDAMRAQLPKALDALSFPVESSGVDASGVPVPGRQPSDAEPC
jgi:hypothetical protein